MIRQSRRPKNYAYVGLKSGNTFIYLDIYVNGVREQTLSRQPHLQPVGPPKNQYSRAMDNYEIMVVRIHDVRIDPEYMQWLGEIYARYCIS